MHSIKISDMEGNKQKMKRIAAIIILLLFIVSCSAKKHIQAILPVETETKTGEAIVKVEPEKTGERMDIPVGVKPSEVVAKIESASGAKVWVVKKKRFLKPAKFEVFENKKAQTEGIKIDKPKKSYAWLWWTIGGIVLLLAADFALRRFLGFNPIEFMGKFIKRIAK